MKKQDKLPEVSTEQLKELHDEAGDASALIKTITEWSRAGAKVPVLVLLRPSRRFEKLLVRELARSKRECGIHCWNRLIESLPDEFKRTEKGGKS